MDTLTLNQLRESYEAVPYLSQPFTYTHPDHLSVIGRLFGLQSPPIDNCRVLELGCGTGVNLIPMAYHLPRSQFIGVDQARRQVDMAHQWAHELGLKNIQLHCGNFMNMDNGALGSFDYIICHGVFSWVPDEVREKILSIISASLAPDGIAIVSYNTYPGWHMREMIRKMMLYHARHIQNPEERIAEGKGIIDFLASAVPECEDPYSVLLRNELEHIRSSMDWYLIHDYMEVVNRPFYFHEFMAKAHDHRLQYLGEAEFGTMLNTSLPDEIGKRVEAMSKDIVQNEQYLDFIRNRQFRQTLLCHGDVKLNRNLDSRVFDGLWIAGETRLDPSTVDLSPGVAHIFKTAQDAAVETDDPMMKAAFLVLNEIWPRTLQMDALWDTSRELLRHHLPNLEISAAHKNDAFTVKLLQCYAGKVIDLHTWEGKAGQNQGEMPEICPLTRHQVKHGHVTVNQWHQVIELDEFAKRMVPLLDGTRNPETVKQEIFEQFKANAITISKNNTPVADPAEAQGFIGESVNKVLGELVKAGLIVS